MILTVLTDKGIPTAGVLHGIIDKTVKITDYSRQNGDYSQFWLPNQDHFDRFDNTGKPLLLAKPLFY